MRHITATLLCGFLFSASVTERGFGQIGLYYGTACNPKAESIATESIGTGSIVIATAGDGDMGVDIDYDDITLSNDPLTAFDDCVVDTSPWATFPGPYIVDAEASSSFGTGTADGTFDIFRTFSAGCDLISITTGGLATANATTVGSVPGGASGNVGHNYNYFMTIAFCVSDPGVITVSGVLSPTADIGKGVESTSCSEYTATPPTEISGYISVANQSGGISTPSPWKIVCPMTGGNLNWSDSLEVCPGEYLMTVSFELEAAFGQTCTRLDEKDTCPPPDEHLIAGTLSAELTYTPCLGDLNGDGVVDLADLAIILGAFGCSQKDVCYDPAADINDDGVVDITDYALLLSNFSNECPVC